jgi:hypothetical protein
MSRMHGAAPKPDMSGMHGAAAPSSSSMMGSSGGHHGGGMMGMMRRSFQQRRAERAARLQRRQSMMGGMSMGASSWTHAIHLHMVVSMVNSFHLIWLTFSGLPSHLPEQGQCQQSRRS